MNAALDSKPRPEFGNRVWALAAEPFDVERGPVKNSDAVGRRDDDVGATKTFAEHDADTFRAAVCVIRKSGRQGLL